ncbi:sorbosone dehydrogenase family protein [Ferruginibacter sp. HRS2-29]|uniref:PQQ-dependent sugar dehydrogenase n=1 Tax=Ferruginibacter sp. HRS2-29 TaxID=2487334 RepID=UPI0020CF8F6C|nr:PQQ-dependent sugar dehydrogenase [Ferruginibacter sp. HRS2-29]MCP9752908.1 glucose/sorbosone dehydrogenase [Ferruginibacter sp. HRS2-29]
MNYTWIGVVILSISIACTNNNSAKERGPLHVRSTAADSFATSTEPSASIGKNVSFNTTFTGGIKKDSFAIRLANGKSFKLAVPKGFKIGIAAEGLRRLRFLTLSPDKRLFATDMYDRSDNTKGRVLIFENWDEQSHKFGKVTTYLEGLHNPNQVAFYKDHIYIAETDKLVRYAYRAGDNQPNGAPQTLATFPAYGLGYKYGGWHLTRSLAFHNDKLYVSVGSSCNACIEKEEIRASVVEMDPDGKNVKFYARGLRNSVGIKWIGDELWATTMGRDLIGPDKPEDLFVKIKRDGYYGWPFYFQYQNKVYSDDQFKDSARASFVKKPEVAFAGFKAHSAPLGFEYFKDFDDPLIKNSVLVCLHGSTSVWRQRGNSVVKVEGGNKYSDIVSGFLAGKTEAGRYGRPCDVLMKDSRSFYFTDDLNGVLYYVWK